MIVNFKIFINKKFEGLADKFAEKEFGIPDEISSFKDKVVIEDEKPIAWIKSHKFKKKYFYVGIYKNPKKLDNFGDVRAISDDEGNLFIASDDQYFNHGDISNVLIDSGQINCKKYDVDEKEEGIYEDNNFILWKKYDDEFVASGSYLYNKNSKKLLDLIKKRYPDYVFNFKKGFEISK